MCVKKKKIKIKIEIEIKKGYLPRYYLIKLQLPDGERQLL